MATYIRDGKKVTYRKWVRGGEVASLWVAGDQPEAIGGNVYFDGDTIYSYGRHFPMGIRIVREDGSVWFLLNGDTYSSSTSAHQRYIRRAVRGLDYFIVPFSALERAQVDRREIVPIETEGERTWTGRYKSRAYNSKTGRRDGPMEEHEYQDHLMGSTLFKVPMPVYGTREEYTWQEQVGTEDAYFLSGLDTSGVQPRSSFFLTRLVRPCTSVADAYESLKPEAVQLAEAQRTDVLRQGEWFFIQGGQDAQTTLDILERHAMRIREKASNRIEFDWPFTGQVVVELTGSLPDSSQRGTRHYANRVAKVGGAVWVRGSIIHGAKEHRVLRLGKTWYRAVENCQLGSWSALGRVD